jgi:hypothetical protein
MVATPESRFMSKSTDQSWWSRAWIWAIPVGCLLSPLLCAGCGAMALLVGLSAIRSSEVYRDAVARATADAQVRAALGDPIQAGFFPAGSFQFFGPTGNANLAIPISGSKKSATIYVVATKTAGKWEYSTLEVAPEGSRDRIDLRSQPTKPRAD